MSWREFLFTVGVLGFTSVVLGLAIGYQSYRAKEMLKVALSCPADARKEPA